MDATTTEEKVLLAFLSAMKDCGLSGANMRDAMTKIVNTQESPDSSCILCKGRGKYPMFSAILPGQPKPDPLMVVCHLCAWKDSAAAKAQGQS